MKPDLLKKRIDIVKQKLTSSYKYGENSYIYYGQNDEEEMHWNKLISEELMNDAWELTLEILDELPMKNVAFRAKNSFAEMKIDPTNFRMGPEEPFMVWEHECLRILDQILVYMLPPEVEQVSESDINRLKRIIKSSGSYITSRKVFGYLPCKEKDVHERINGLLKIIYPDLSENYTENKVVKNFIPDGYIPSIKTAIEYKYINKKCDQSPILDQIYADCAGYKNHETENIIFVIYETERFVHEPDLITAIEKAGYSLNAASLIIYGTPPIDYDYQVKKILKDKLQPLTLNKVNEKSEPSDK